MSAPSDLYDAAYRLVALEDGSHTLADRAYAVSQVRAALEAEGEPSAPVVTTGADGSVTTTWWDGTYQVVDAGGSVVTQRTVLPPAQPVVLAADEIYSPETGQVFKMVNVEPAGTTQAAEGSPASPFPPVVSPVLTTADVAAASVPPESAPAPVADLTHDAAVAAAEAAIVAVPAVPVDDKAAHLSAAQADLGDALVQFPDSPQLQDLKVQLDALSA